MRKWIVVLAVVVIVAAAVVLVAAGGNDNNKSATNETGNTNTNASSTPNNSSASQSNDSTDEVSISNFAFSPSTITVKKGTSVTWTNNDSVAHTVTVDSGSGPNSDTLSPGKTYSFTFDTAGTFNYHCSIHTSMHGTVTVTE